MGGLSQLLSTLCGRFSFHSGSRAGAEIQRRPVGTALTFLACLLMLAGCLQSAHAQEVTGSIVGLVTDPQGAAIKGAAVTVQDTERGTSLKTTTNDSGAFTFPRVPVGHYSVTVSATGFQAERHSGLELTLNQTARFDFHLKVGQAAETVEVQATAPLLETETSLLSSLINSKVASELPLSTHNTNQLTLVSSPGVITPNLLGFQAAQNTFGTVRPYANGA